MKGAQTIPRKIINNTITRAFQIVYDEAPIIPIMNETRYSVATMTLKVLSQDESNHDFSHHFSIDISAPGWRNVNLAKFIDMGHD